jgi:hypothetical protein
MPPVGVGVPLVGSGVAAVPWPGRRLLDDPEDIKLLKNNALSVLNGP